FAYQRIPKGISRLGKVQLLSSIGPKSHKHSGDKALKVLELKSAILGVHSCHFSKLHAPTSHHLLQCHRSGNSPRSSSFALISPTLLCRSALMRKGLRMASGFAKEETSSSSTVGRESNLCKYGTERKWKMMTSCSGATSYTYLYYTLLLELGARLPFSNIKCLVLRTLNAAPTQLHLNTFEILYEGLRKPLSLNIFFGILPFVELRRFAIGHTLLRVFRESYKFFKDQFFLVRGKEGCFNYLFDVVGESCFPLFWTKCSTKAIKVPLLFLHHLKSWHFERKRPILSLMPLRFLHMFLSQHPGQLTKEPQVPYPMNLSRSGPNKFPLADVIYQHLSAPSNDDKVDTLGITNACNALEAYSNYSMVLSRTIKRKYRDLTI
ncbi:hypothetical protein CR513_47691, partial [Mucuna pruriens]